MQGNISQPKTIYSASNIGVVVEDEPGKSRVIGVPMMSFFDNRGEICYLAAPHKEGIETDAVRTAILKYVKNPVSRGEIFQIIEYHLRHIGGEDFSYIKEVKSGGVDVAAIAAETINEYMGISL